MTWLKFFERIMTKLISTKKIEPVLIFIVQKTRKTFYLFSRVLIYAYLPPIILGYYPWLWMDLISITFSLLEVKRRDRKSLKKEEEGKDLNGHKNV